MSRVLTLADRAEILKLADACADNKDEFGLAFYNASVVRFAIAISRLCADTKTQSFNEKYPPNPDARCKCEHWQACADCHPTYIDAALKGDV